MILPWVVLGDDVNPRREIRGNEFMTLGIRVTTILIKSYTHPSGIPSLTSPKSNICTTPTHPHTLPPTPSTLLSNHYPHLPHPIITHFPPNNPPTLLPTSGAYPPLSSFPFLSILFTPSVEKRSPTGCASPPCPTCPATRSCTPSWRVLTCSMLVTFVLESVSVGGKC